MPCYAMLCYVVSCIRLYFILLCYIIAFILSYPVLPCDVLKHNMLYDAILWCIILMYINVYYVIFTH